MRGILKNKLNKRKRQKEEPKTEHIEAVKRQKGEKMKDESLKKEEKKEKSEGGSESSEEKVKRKEEEKSEGGSESSEEKGKRKEGKDLKEVNTFKALPILVSLGEGEGGREKTFKKYLYFKKHIPQQTSQEEEEEEEENCLFVLNIPPYFEESELEEVFRKCGAIKRIHFSPLHNNGNQNLFSPTLLPFPSSCSSSQLKTAIVSFYEEKALEKALSMKEEQFQQPILSVTNHSVGLLRWIEEQRNEKRDPDKLKEEVDKFMEEFDLRQKKERKKLLKKTKKRGNGAEEEFVEELEDPSNKKKHKELGEGEGKEGKGGWTLVTYKLKKKPSKVSSTQLKKVDKEREKKTSISNFYNFQRSQDRKDSSFFIPFLSFHLIPFHSSNAFLKKKRTSRVEKEIRTGQESN